MSDASALLPVYNRLDVELVSARGCWLETADGRRLLDLYGGHAVTPLGHGHPALGRALSEGHAQLDFFSNSVRMAVQERAARALLDGSAHLGAVHFVNSGTEANEAALHLARRLTGRTRVLSFDCSFHGRTLASLGVTGLAGYRGRLSLPLDPSWYGALRYGEPADLAAIDDDVAAVLCESVPSLAGVLMPPAGYYPALAARCREVGAMLIFDEVQGGVGRLGRWFAHDLFGVQPDLVTLAKSVAGGYPVGALLVAAAHVGRVEPGELGTTYGGGPLACRMVETVAQVIRDDGLMARAEQIFAGVAGGLAGLDGVAVRGAGCLIGIRGPRPAAEVRDDLLARGVLVGTSADPHALRLLPPYVLSDDELAQAVATLRDVLSST